MIENWIIWLYGIGCIIESIILVYFVKREDEITIGDLLLTIIFILSSWLCVLLEFIAFRKEILKTVIWRRKNE